MKLISYKGTRPGIAGFGNWCVRTRTKSIYSHSEVMFEPGDGPDVAALMPDGSLEPDANGALWAYSATATDVMPAWSELRCRRAGQHGGCRFKRIKPDPKSWDVDAVPFDPLAAAKFCVQQEGKYYDWRHIFSFFNVLLVGVVINYFVNQGPDHWTCAEVVGGAFGFPKPEVFEPRILAAVAQGSQRLAVRLRADFKRLEAE